ncbi:MAG TPA: hypothetical protein VGD29_01755 [Actinoplanes sp.]|jgi:hypothetical protein
MAAQQPQRMAAVVPGRFAPVGPHAGVGPVDGTGRQSTLQCRVPLLDQIQRVRVDRDIRPAGGNQDQVVDAEGASVEPDLYGHIDSS